MECGGFVANPDLAAKQFEKFKLIWKKILLYENYRGNHADKKWTGGFCAVSFKLNHGRQRERGAFNIYSIIFITL